LIKALHLGFDPLAEDVAGAIHGAAARSIAKVVTLESADLSEGALRTYEQRVRAEIEASFGDGSWTSSLPGRETLKAYAETLPNGISYETLRNMIVNRMADAGYKPSGMVQVVQAILAAS
jgi:hypothetical protein